MSKYIYFFGNGKAGGRAACVRCWAASANLADMASIGAVPPGFTITTEACAKFYEIGEGELHKLLSAELDAAITRLETATGKTFGHGANPLLVSVRSGAAASMPGMMDTVLNLGLSPETVQAMIARTGNPRFVWDSFRRFIQMFGNVVLGVEHHRFEHELAAVKDKVGVKLDSDPTRTRCRVVATCAWSGGDRQDFPVDTASSCAAASTPSSAPGTTPAQSSTANSTISAVSSATVNVQAMVFGNSGNQSGTGVAFTRDPRPATPLFLRQYLINAQGEDVVAGIRAEPAHH